MRSEGFDLELQGAVTQAWQVGVGYTYSTAEYRNDATFAPGTVFDTSLPEHMLKVFTTWAPLGNGGPWRLGGGVYWQSSSYYDTRNWDTPPPGEDWRNEQAAYAIVNLMASYRLSKHALLQLNVNNLFDKTYYRSLGYSPTWGSTENYGEPRNLLLTLRTQF